MKTFVLGVGAQKSGTTWLHDYLHWHFECNMGITKEYEVFSYIDLGDTGHFSVEKKKIMQILNRPLKLNPGDTNHFKLMTFCCDENEYFKYFDDILINGGVSVTGDITPSYAALATGTYKKIKTKFEERGVRTKVIFIMRDPVERNVSATKLYLGNRSDNLVEQLTSDNLNQMTVTNHLNVMNKATTRYDTTIQNLEAVFKSGSFEEPDTEILYLFYEDLFDIEKMEGEIKKLCTFLGISYVPANPEPINESRIKFPVYPETRKIIYDYYKPVYDFVEEKFGRLPWIRY